MRTMCVALLFAAVFAVVFAAPEEAKYTSKFDNVNLDEILQSTRLLNNYCKCLLEEGKCTPDGSELKRVLPDALKTGCSKCNEKQKEGANKVVAFLIDTKNPCWEKLEAKYDPEHVYLNKYKGLIKH